MMLSQMLDRVRIVGASRKAFVAPQAVPQHVLFHQVLSELALVTMLVLEVAVLVRAREGIVVRLSGLPRGGVRRRSTQRGIWCRCRLRHGVPGFPLQGEVTPRAAA